jgi:hypothetical protein
VLFDGLRLLDLDVRAIEPHDENIEGGGISIRECRDVCTGREFGLEVRELFEQDVLVDRPGIFLRANLDEDNVCSKIPSKGN